MSIVIRGNQAFEKLSTSQCGQQTLLRPTQMPLKAVVAKIAAARTLPDIDDAIKERLACRKPESDTHPTLGEIPRAPQPAVPLGRNVACGVGSYGPRGLVKQSLRQIAR